MRLREVAPSDAFDTDAVGEGGGALLADRLALARGEVGEERLEIRVTGIEEMKLLAGALQEAGFAKRLPFLGGRKGDMDRRGAGLLTQRAQPGDQCLARSGIVFVGNEQPAPVDRRERHADLELRVVIATRPLIRIGPGVVENIFALRMGLQIAGRDG